MNSLTYLSRQFDVLASPKTAQNSDDAPRLQRVSTWSSKSFLFPLHATPKRSHSSPSLHRHQLSAVLPTPPVSENPRHISSVIRQIFFIRVFLLVWDNLSSVWTSFVTRYNQRQERLKEAEQQPGQVQVQQPEPSRSSTPALNARKTPFHLPKTLVLDLDETLIHSTSRPLLAPATRTGLFGLASLTQHNKGAGHMVEVVLGGRSTLYHVYKRPFVDFFLRTVSGWYTLVIFTASMQEYADPVIDWLDAGRGILAHRFFRDSCTQLPNGSYTKDLSIVDTDLSRVCLVDNSPISYRVNEANGIPIEGWTHDPYDEALLDLLPVLDSLRFTSDVRRVLGLRSAGVRLS